MDRVGTAYVEQMDQNVQYVCGMSVPPVMMANIASEVNKQWFEGL